MAGDFAIRIMMNDDQTKDGIKIVLVVDDRDKDKITTRLESIRPICS